MTRCGHTSDWSGTISSEVHRDCKTMGKWGTHTHTHTSGSKTINPSLWLTSCCLTAEFRAAAQPTGPPVNPTASVQQYWVVQSNWVMWSGRMNVRKVAMMRLTRINKFTFTFDCCILYVWRVVFPYFSFFNSTCRPPTTSCPLTLLLSSASTSSSFPSTQTGLLAWVVPLVWRVTHSSHPAYRFLEILPAPSQRVTSHQWQQAVWRHSCSWGGRGGGEHAAVRLGDVTKKAAVNRAYVDVFFFSFWSYLFVSLLVCGGYDEGENADDTSGFPLLCPRVPEDTK